MSGEAWAQLGFGGAFFALIVFVVQAMVRGTWKPANTVDLLLNAKDELIKLKDGQIGLLTVELEAWKTTATKQSDQIGLFAEASRTTEHFFREVPRVTQTGDNDDSMEA